MCLMFELWGQIDWKSCFREDLGWNQVFLKNFSSFYSLNNVLWGVSALKCSIFQKFVFSKFLIDRTCCSIDKKCNKNFGYNLSNSIGAWLELDWLKLLFDQSNLIFNRSKINQWVFKKVFLSHVLHTFRIFSRSPYTVLA